MSKRIWLIGAGSMAAAYLAVLRHLGHEPLVVCRRQQSAQRFATDHSAQVVFGGVEAALADRGAPEITIVATPVETLSYVGGIIADAGVSAILLEKPAALSAEELAMLREKSARSGSWIAIAYNRRFYSSVRELRRRIDEEGGIRQITFDFTEMSDRVASSPASEASKRCWFLANSTHVVDLAFFLAGLPEGDWTALMGGALDWHPSASRFAGAGITDRKAVFCYSANWEVPGRWGLEIATSSSKYLLCPVEKLATLTSALAPPENIVIDDKADREFKPGLLAMVECFLDDPASERLCSIDDHAAAFPHYLRMAGYK